jgi:DNA uptake protein ComE-like DNA-binding protein
MYKQWIFISFIILLAGCTATQSKEQEAPEEQTVEKSPLTQVLTQLNPNRASKEELLTIEAFDEAIVNMLIDSRPYLDMTSFHTVLSAQLTDSVNWDELYQRIFVPINLNTAAESEFLLVPGVGAKMAHEFEEYRPYQKVEQFRREIGKYVDESEVARYEQFVFVPFDLNTATDEELLSIPGVGDKMLHEFQEYRPYASMEQFRREIGKYVTAEEVALYERYVRID